MLLILPVRQQHVFTRNGWLVGGLGETTHTCQPGELPISQLFRSGLDVGCGWGLLL